MGLMNYKEWYWRNYVFRVGYHLIIGDGLYRVVNRNVVYPFEKNPGSAWLLGTNTEGTKESISDYLEAGKNVLYGLMIGVYADLYYQIKLFKPGASQLGGIKNETNVPITTLSSPLDNPTALIFNFGNEKESIEFTPKNISGHATTKYVRIGGYGHKYLLDKEGEWDAHGNFRADAAHPNAEIPRVWTKVPTVVIKEVSA